MTPLAPPGLRYTIGVPHKYFLDFSQKKCDTELKEIDMAKQPNLEKARLQSEAYAKMIRNMIDALNSDLVDLKVKEDKIKLIPETKDAPVRKMFGAAMRTMKSNQPLLDEDPNILPQGISSRVEKKLEALKKEREKFAYRYSMQRGDKRTLEQKKNDGSREPMRGRDISGQAYE